MMLVTIVHVHTCIKGTCTMYISTGDRNKSKIRTMYMYISTGDRNKSKIRTMYMYISTGDRNKSKIRNLPYFPYKGVTAT